MEHLGRGEEGVPPPRSLPPPRDTHAPGGWLVLSTLPRDPWVSIKNLLPSAVSHSAVSHSAVSHSAVSHSIFFPPLRECLFCLHPGTKEHTFTRCCQQACHEFYALSWTKRYPPRPCLYCRQAHPLSTLTVIYPQDWKEDPHFVEQVKELCLWYCVCRKGNDTFEGFFGELQDPNEPTRTRVCFLGHTQSEVIPHMKACLSCQ